MIKIPYLVIIFLGYGLITWISRKQELVTLSSTEVEYIVVTNVVAQAL